MAPVMAVARRRATPRVSVVFMIGFSWMGQCLAGRSLRMDVAGRVGQDSSLRRVVRRARLVGAARRRIALGIELGERATLVALLDVAETLRLGELLADFLARQ